MMKRDETGLIATTKTPLIVSSRTCEQT